MLNPSDTYNLGSAPQYRSFTDTNSYPSSVVISDAKLTILSNPYNVAKSSVFARRRAISDRTSRSWSSSVPQAILDNWNFIALSGISEQKYRAIYKLASAEDGWRGPLSLKLQSECLHQFLTFWIETKSFATAPHLSLSPKGHLIGQWYKNTKRNLTLEFMTEGRIYVGLQDGENEYDGIDNFVGAISFLKNRDSQPLRWR